MVNTLRYVLMERLHKAGTFMLGLNMLGLNCIAEAHC